ncbi:MAG: hypothetical protein ACLRIS_10160 [Flavonifractor plautii]
MVRIMQMFADGRSRKVVFLAHCLLNQNAISDGTAVYPAAFRELVQFFLEHQVGIVQLPCPEPCCLGLDRGNRQGAQSPVTEENTRIRAAMQAPAPSRMLEDLVESVMHQVLEYHRYGFRIIAFLAQTAPPTAGGDHVRPQSRDARPWPFPRRTGEIGFGRPAWKFLFWA